MHVIRRVVGHVRQAGAIRFHHVDFFVLVSLGYKGYFVAEPGEVRGIVRRSIVRNICLACAVGVHDVDFVIGVAVGGKGDSTAVAGQVRRRVIEGVVRDSHFAGAVAVHHEDLHVGCGRAEVPSKHYRVQVRCRVGGFVAHGIARKADIGATGEVVGNVDFRRTVTQAVEDDLLLSLKIVDFYHAVKGVDAHGNRRTRIHGRDNDVQGALCAVRSSGSDNELRQECYRGWRGWGGQRSRDTYLRRA